MPGVMETAALLTSAAPPPAAGGGADRLGGEVMRLFWESADVFTGLIALGSFIAVAIIIRSLIEVREAVILPKGVVERMRDRIAQGDVRGAHAAAEESRALPARVVDAALRQAHLGRPAAREAAELAASEESAGWFRRIEMLNVIGHLGPLLGLVGTVYGMIIAFAALGETGGNAGPGELSVGIAKALFHTFLGLMLAIPALFAYGYFRGVVDRVCTRGMVVSSELFEALPDSAFGRRGG